MPQFAYTIIREDGREESGLAEAADERAAAQKIRSMGGVVTRLSRAGASSTAGGGTATPSWMVLSIPLKEKVVFAVNLSVMVGSGLPVSRAVGNLAEQTSNKSVREIIAALHQDVLKGTALSDAMARHKVMFDDLFVNMVRVGEAGGSLEESLQIIAAQLEKEQQLRSRVRGAMMYPAIVLVAMIGIAILMLTYILPQIMGVFKDMQVTLPTSTRVIIAMSEGLQTHAGAVSAVGAVLLLGGFLFLRTPSGKHVLSAVAIGMPIVRTMAIAVNCARFSRIYSSLLRSGVPVVEALGIVRDTLSNTYYKAAVTDAIAAVQKGQPLGESIRRYPRIFPVIVPQMIDVGEETGKTSAMLLKIAEFYEAQVDQMTKNLSSIIEPLLMVVIGGGVGFFAVAMLKPMYSVMENIK